ncbi:MAG TPA: hypothetical protein VH333_11965 [Pseudonocardiaceae bacterium]|nr:hypothetical protein [Pseudonocardiaceae bacterium]
MGASARWVNTMTAGETTCRLVTSAEMTDPVVGRVFTSSGGATWQHPEAGNEPELCAVRSAAA